MGGCLAYPAIQRTTFVLVGWPSDIQGPLRVRTCGDQVQELCRATPLPGRCVPGQEGGPPAGQRVEATLPTT